MLMKERTGTGFFILFQFALGQPPPSLLFSSLASFPLSWDIGVADKEVEVMIVCSRFVEY